LSGSHLVRNKRMKIVIAAWHLRDWNVGIGRYVHGLVEMLGQVDVTNQYEILLPGCGCDFPFAQNIRYRSIRIPFFRRRMWEQVAPNLVGPYDVLHFPYDSCVLRKRGKFVITIHDIKPVLFKQSRPKRNLNSFIEHMVIPSQSKQVDHVVTVSEWSKKDIVQHLPFSEKQITVVPPGVDSAHFRPASSLEASRPSRPYVLSVAGSDPTKNLESLVEAFAKLPADLRETYDLVLAGDLKDRVEVHTQVRQLGLEPQTRFPGIVTESQLVNLYQHADVFVFPSRYEGFGLPVLEAMACGCPVISSNASSLPEVYGDAALSSNPSDVSGFARHLERVLSDPTLRQELRQKSLARASRFSWERTAREMVNVYTKVAGC
jgi:glycosyltransferase involved in cell wall biosynthesis